MKDFFVSYTAIDQRWAEWISWQLEHAGYKVILQTWDFRPGSNFVLEMQRANELSKTTIALLSEEYLKKAFPLSEWAMAFAQDPDSKKRKLIPVRISDVSPKGLLSSIVYIDLYDIRSEDEAVATLLKGIKNERVKPMSQPQFPPYETNRKDKPPFPDTIKIDSGIAIKHPSQKKRQLPPCDPGPVPEYSIQPASFADIQWIAELEKSSYDDDDSIPENKLREWFQVNPTGFFLILEEGRRIGHIDILPIKEEDPIFELFLKGAIKEINIPGTSIYPADKKQQIQRLYVESVIIDSQKSRKDGGAEAYRYLLAHVISLVKAVAETNNVQYVYAIGATDAGIEVLTSLGFEVDTSAEQRSDRHNLYRVNLPVLVTKINSRLRHCTVSMKQEFDQLLRRAFESGL